MNTLFRVAFTLITICIIIVTVLSTVPASKLNLSRQLAKKARAIGNPFKQLHFNTPSFQSDVQLSKQSCKLCLLDPSNALCYISPKISDASITAGSGTRTRAVLDRANKGEVIRIGVLGASVTAGHGLSLGDDGKTQKSFNEVFFDDFQKLFPSSELTVAGIPATNSEFFSYCMDSVMSLEYDIYLIELDINTPAGQSFVPDDRLHRFLLALPQKPAVIRVSAMQLFFPDLLRGVESTMVQSQYFDIPVISIRAVLMPHLILNPQFVPDFFPNNDPRHFGVLGHQLLGDLISLFFREQLCEMKRSALLPSPILRPAIKTIGRRRIDDPPRNVWPTDDVFQAIPRLYLWERYSSTFVVPGLVDPSCRFVGSIRQPLEPSLISPEGSWSIRTWNDKNAYSSTTVGSEIRFSIHGRTASIISWFAWDREVEEKDRSDEDRPGRASCWMLGKEEEAVIIDAKTDFNGNEFRWTHVAKDLSTLNNTMVCRLLPETSTAGNNFRIFGFASANL